MNNLTIKPTRFVKVFVYADIHAGAEHLAAVNLASVMAKAVSADIEINLADNIDASMVSRFRSKPEKLAQLQIEIDKYAALQRIINKGNPKSKKYTLHGNHDLRVETYTVAKAPALASLKVMEFENIMGYDALDMTFVRQSILVGNVEFTHGVYARAKAGYSALAHLDNRVDRSVVIGHAHRSALVTRRTASGKTLWGVEVGTLGDPARMTYMNGRVADWTASVLLVSFVDVQNPTFELIPFTLTANTAKAVWRGKEYSVNLT